MTMRRNCLELADPEDAGVVKVDAGVGRLARLSAALSSAACRRIRSISRAS